MFLAKTATYIYSLLLLFSVASVAEVNQCENAKKERFNKSDLLEMVRSPKCQIKTISDVVKHLPSFMKLETVLMNRSQSIQGPHRTDYIFPRAILNSMPFEAKNSAIALSFNGHSKQPGFLQLEVMAVDPAKSYHDMFEYFDIEFPSETEASLLSWEQAQSKIKVSEANPNRCQKCHGSPARPIFEQYPNWEGALGKRHTAELTDEEKTGLIQFLETHKNDDQSRYYWLNLKDVSVSAQLNFPRNQMVFRLGEQNLNFNARLFSYNSLRVAKLVKQLTLYEKLKFAIWGASYECSNIKDFFPNDILKVLSKAVHYR